MISSRVGLGLTPSVFNSGFGKVTVTDFSTSQDVLTFDHKLFSNPTFSQVPSQTHDFKGRRGHRD